jgi:hypothetical protein
MSRGYGRHVRRARRSWRIPLAVALVALPLAGLSLLAADDADGPLPADRAAVVQPRATPASPAAVRSLGGTTDAARVADAARALGLVAVLLAVAGVAVLAAGGRTAPATVRAGRPVRGIRPTGRAPPLLPR